METWEIHGKGWYELGAYGLRRVRYRPADCPIRNSRSQAGAMAGRGATLSLCEHATKLAIGLWLAARTRATPHSLRCVARGRH